MADRRRNDKQEGSIRPRLSRKEYGTCPNSDRNCARTKLSARYASELVLRRHQPFQLVEPVQDDVKVGRSLDLTALDHQKMLAVGCDIVRPSYPALIRRRQKLPRNSSLGGVTLNRGVVRTETTIMRSFSR